MIEPVEEACQKALLQFAVGFRHTRHHRHAQHLLHLLCRVEAAVELLEEEGQGSTKRQPRRQPDHRYAGLLGCTGAPGTFARSITRADEVLRVPSSLVSLNFARKLS